MTLDPRLYLVGQLLVGWHLEGSTAPPGPESIDRMLAVVDAILERMGPLPLEEKEIVHLLDGDRYPLCGFAATCFITDVLRRATCKQCIRLQTAGAAGDFKSIQSKSALDPTWEAGNAKE